jgi:hypothetical protein
MGGDPEGRDMLYLLLASIAVILYFLPGIIAGRRRHRNYPAIAVLNIFLGWTFLGWIGALIWSLTDNVKPRVPIPEQHLNTGG